MKRRSDRKARQQEAHQQRLDRRKAKRSTQGDGAPPRRAEPKVKRGYVPSLMRKMVKKS